MAFDGLTISGIVRELKSRAIGGRINKIQQTESDEIDLVIKNGKDNNLKLMISVNPSLPLVYLTDSLKQAPMTAPNFCMLLRKHIGNGRIKDIEQPGFDRIIKLVIEHLDEMGDVREKALMIELMGRHSNIIFMDDTGRILDSIKRVPLDVSSVRQVLPGMQYEYPKAEDKYDPRELTEEEFSEKVMGKAGNAAKLLSSSLNGIAYVTANEICERAGVDGGASSDQLSDEDKKKLWEVLGEMLREDVMPCIYLEDGVPKDYSIVPFKIYRGFEESRLDSVSEMLRTFYQMKNDAVRMKQKTSELRHVISSMIERTVRKLDLQKNQMKDTEDREKFRIYGELLNTYGYSLEPGARELVCQNYYDDNKEIKIPIPENSDAREASKKYFDKYNKKKRTAIALEDQIKASEDELQYLKSVQLSLDIASLESDISDIRRELIESGFLRGSAAERIKDKNKKGKRREAKGKPLHYISSDGFDIFVGKNNFQNDELTFQIAGPNDMWFHAKKAPGSHVIVRRNRDEEIPDNTYLEAARLAAFYSTVESDKVEIDYTERKNLKKPPAAALGYVIYHTNYSVVVEKNIEGIKQEN